MKRRLAGVRGAAVILALAAGLAGCRDSGLPDRNLPAEAARTREYGYPVYEASPDARPVAAAGRHWIRGAPEEQIPGTLMVPVAADGAVQLYAPRHARAPYDRLYAPAGQDRWTPYLRLN
jgi:hypothetical protein